MFSVLSKGLPWSFEYEGFFIVVGVKADERNFLGRELRVRRQELLVKRACLRLAVLTDDDGFNAVRQVLVPVEPINDKLIVLPRILLAVQESAKILWLPGPSVAPEISGIARPRWIAKFVILARSRATRYATFRHAWWLTCLATRTSIPSICT